MRSAFLTGFLSLVFLATASADDSNYVLPVGNNEIKIMAYNIENLFDAEHDEGKRDYEFLPKNHPQKNGCGNNRNCQNLDWTWDKVYWKFERIAQAIAGQGDLPDMLILVEVENDAIIAELAGYLGYEWFVMTNSPDQRGIDNAILFNEYKFTYLDYFEGEVPGLQTRNISAMSVALNPELGGGVLVVSPNHWPSQISKTSNPKRMLVAQHLQDMLEQIRTYYSQYPTNFVITGDFNVIEGENPNPIFDGLFDGSSLGLFDLREWAIQSGNAMIPQMPPATYYYDRENVWNEFDRFLLDGALADGAGLEVDPHSYRIHAPTYLRAISRSGEHIPYGYDHYTNDPNRTGFSDHFAVVMKLRYQ